MLNWVLDFNFSGAKHLLIVVVAYVSLPIAPKCLSHFSSLSTGCTKRIEHTMSTVLQDFCILRALLLEEELQYDDVIMSRVDIPFWKTIEVEVDDSVRTMAFLTKRMPC